MGGGIAVDINSNAYITGGTNFTDMPLLNAYQATNEGGFDAFVAKINPSGVTGTNSCIRLISAARATMWASASQWIPARTLMLPVRPLPRISTPATTGTTALQSANGGGTDAFLAKLGIPCTGTCCTTFDVPLTYFTYLGGAGTDIAHRDHGRQQCGGARIIGWTNSPNFPIVGKRRAVDLWRRQQRRVLCQP